MFSSRRRDAVYGVRVSVATLAFVIAFSACALSAFAALDTEIVGPRMMTITGPDGAPKTIPDQAVAGQVVVELKAGTTQAEFDALLVKLNGSVLRAIPRFNQYVVSLPDGTSVLEGRAMWAAEAGVKLCEPDRIMYLMYTPDDPLYPGQYQWERTAAPAAWDVQQGSPTTVIAIIDRGSDLDHEDLAAKYWVNTDEALDGADTDNNGFIDDINGWDFYYDDNDTDAGPAPGDPYSPSGVSHGIHCAGLAAAASDNGIGVAGYDWGAQVMPVRVFPPDDGTSTSIINAGIAYAIDNGADIISMSIGGGYSSAMDTPIAQAHAAGVLVVVSAGNETHVFTNDPSSWMSPVCNDGPNLGVDNFVLGVGATDVNDVIASFTNRDASDYNFVDVMSPGVQTWSTYYYDPSIPGLEEMYGPMSGTSMACPIAAGLCGLLVAHFPTFSPDEIVTQIRSTCDNIDDLNPLEAGTLGSGRINGAGAIGLDVPPDPIGNLQAYDTPLDEGGSITVTWTVSRHDTVDVVAYDLMRAPEDIVNPGLPGPMGLLAVLPPGTSNYTDTPVTDETNYWYQVMTRDASNSVPSTVAGPAAARDDLAPEPITTIVAADTQADAGGSISVSWYGYDYPDDLQTYNIYRAETTFTNISAMTPIAVVNGAAVQNYMDATTADNTSYWYAVTGVDDHDNEDPQVVTAGPVVSNPNLSFSYPPGLSMMAIGAMPATADSRKLADILGIQEGDGTNLAWYDAANPADPYIIYADNPLHPAFDQALGRAWWLRTTNALLINISGQPAPPGDFEVPVVAGWSQFGNPFSVPLDFSITQVTGIGQGTPVSLQTSNELGFTRDYAWGYDPFANSYVLISGAAVDFATPTLPAGRGVFFLARKPATLVLKRPVAVASVSKPARSAFDGWKLRIVAEADGVADVDNYLGVTSQAAALNGIATPPRPDVDLDLYFVRPAGEQMRWATDFVTAADNRATWQMRVACSMAGAQVNLSWPDMSSLPADCRPILTDDATGRTIYLRTSTGYSYEASADATERTFTLTLGSDAGTLAITSLAVAGGDGGAQLAYTLSQDAAVDVAVLNIAGVVVRRVLAGRQQTAGPQQLIWDGRNAAGASAPAGVYLVRVQARAADGQQISVVRTVQVSR